MQLTIKNIEPKDFKKVDDLMYYCFGMGGTRDPENEVNKYQATYNLEYCWGYYENNELVSTWINFPWEVAIRGQYYKSGAVADVTTQPEFRRKGYVRQLFMKSLQQMKDNGILISGLYPFKFPYYEKFGYAIGSEAKLLRCNPRELLLPDNFTILKIKEIPKENSYEILAIFRNDFGSKYNFVKLPDKKNWDIRMYGDKDQIYGIYDPHNKLVGYFITRIVKLTTGQWDASLDLKEVITNTRDAFYTVLHYIKQHTDQLCQFRWRIIDDELNFNNFYEKYEPKIEIQPLVMYRIVDVVKALETLKVNPTLNTNFTLKIVDPNAEWNNQPVKLSINKGAVNVSKIESDEVDLELDINSFTQLFIGYQSIKELEYQGKAKVDPDKIDVIDLFFPKVHTRLLIHF
ncbi:MAG: GNAT family N-acetyltransferase [Asgard group archaeon]|nr:GNAT family N-acetyltransferase [Asgard group archaeon]